MTRSVSPRRTDYSNTEMTLVGRVIPVVLLVVLLPILPFLAILWLFDRIGTDPQ